MPSLDEQTPHTHLITKSIMQSPPDAMGDNEEFSNAKEEEEVLSEDDGLWSKPRSGMAQSVRVRYAMGPPPSLADARTTSRRLVFVPHGGKRR